MRGHELDIPKQAGYRRKRPSNGEKFERGVGNDLRAPAMLLKSRAMLAI
jgi:hypothetical protein